MEEKLKRTEKSRFIEELDGHCMKMLEGELNSGTIPVKEDLGNSTNKQPNQKK